MTHMAAIPTIKDICKRAKSRELVTELSRDTESILRRAREGDPALMSGIVEAAKRLQQEISDVVGEL